MRFLKYAFRWQASTPVLAVAIWLLPFNIVTQTLLANLAGAAIFYKIDQHIFKHKTHPNNTVVDTDNSNH